LIDLNVVSWVNINNIFKNQINTINMSRITPKLENIATYLIKQSMLKKYHNLCLDK